MMRKFVALCGALMLVAASCTSGDDDNGGGESDSTENVGETTDEGDDGDGADEGDGEEGEEAALAGELTVTTWAATAAGWEDWFPMLAEEFSAQHPDVSIEVEQIAFSDYVSGLTTRFVAGEGPELIHIPLPLTTLPAWGESGFLMDLADFVEETGIAGEWPDAQSAMEWEGETYGVLLQDYGYMLFYNEELLEEAGVEIPTTVDELIEAAAATTDGENYGYAVAADQTVNFLRDIFHFVTGTGAEWIDGDSWNLTDQAVVDGVDIWRTLATEYAPQGTDINQKRQAWFNGNAAMMIEGPFIVGQIEGNAPDDVVESLHATQLPLPSPTGDVSNGMAINAGIDPELEPVAKAFLEFVTSEESMRELAVSVTSPSALRDANSVLVEADNPDLAEVAEAAESTGGLLFPADATGLRENFSDFESIAVDALQQLLTSDVATEDVLADLQAELEANGITP